jgi:hypothetical protein
LESLGVAFIALIVLGLAVGEEEDTGSGEGAKPASTTPTGTNAQATPEPERTVTPRAQAVARVKRAATSLKQQGTSAARNPSGVEVSDFSPSEEGAALLVRRGYISEKRFCPASDVLLQAEDDEHLLNPDYFR